MPEVYSEPSYYYERMFLQDKSFRFIQVYTSKKTATNTCPA